QLVIATDMRKPPGVTIWRNGALVVMSCNAAKMSVSFDSAKPRNTTAPGHNSSRQVRPCSASPNKFNVIDVFSDRIMENDSRRVPPTGTKTAHAMAQIDTIHPARPLHRPVM